MRLYPKLFSTKPQQINTIGNNRNRYSVNITDFVLKSQKKGLKSTHRSETNTVHPHNAQKFKLKYVGCIQIFYLKKKLIGISQ